MSRVSQHFLDLFFYPESVAVVGATNNADTFNFNLLANLVNLKFPGKIYPVNPNTKEVMGIKSYPDLKSINGNIDLVVISIPASKTLGIIRDCVAKKVKGVVLVPGGFSEIGERGKKAQDEIFSLLRENGIRATGPNALSPINTANNFAISFFPIEKLTKGKLSFIFQSGLYEPRLKWILSDLNLHLNKLIDLGNKMDINEVDALEYLAQDPETKVIAIHLESIAGDARAFMRLLKYASKEKPVIVLKSGRTVAGAKAASSHTGAIIKSSDTIFDVALRQSGAIRAQTLGDFFDLAKIFEYLFPLKKNRIAVLAGSGGEGVMAVDSCQFNGLTLAQFSPETQRKLHSVFPLWDIPVNPFDTGVSIQFHDTIDVFSVLLDALADDQNVDCLGIQIMPAYFLGLDKFIKLALGVIKRGKPVVTWATRMLGGSAKATPAVTWQDSISRGSVKAIQQLESNRIPVYPTPERAIKALSALYQYGITQEAIH